MRSFPTKMLFSNSSPKSQPVVHNASLLAPKFSAVSQMQNTLSSECPEKLILWETMCGINIRNKTVINHHKWKSFKWKYFTRSNSAQTHSERTKRSNRSLTNQTSQIRDINKISLKSPKTGLCKSTHEVSMKQPRAEGPSYSVHKILSWRKCCSFFLQIYLVLGSKATY